MAKFNLGTGGMNADYFATVLNPESVDSLRKLVQMDEAFSEQRAMVAKLSEASVGLGIPPYYNGIGIAPFDILSDRFRGTEGAWMDSLYRRDEVLAFCELMVEKQIAGWQYYKFIDAPIKRVFWPLHKGMDGLMSPKDFDELYWQPMLTCINALAEMGVESLIYGEGYMNSRIHTMEGLPVGMTIVHMEYADAAECKKAFDGIAVLSGFIPTLNLAFGTVDKVIDDTKRLLDILADGKGYIFDFVHGLDNATRENFEACIQTVIDWK
jgi:hypothetical protein